MLFNKVGRDFKDKLVCNLGTTENVYRSSSFTLVCCPFHIKLFQQKLSGILAGSSLLVWHLSLLC